MMELQSLNRKERVKKIVSDLLDAIIVIFLVLPMLLSELAGSILCLELEEQRILSLQFVWAELTLIGSIAAFRTMCWLATIENPQPSGWADVIPALIVMGAVAHLGIQKVLRQRYESDFDPMPSQ
ncbi:MAG: hypothetical protein WCT32_02945 [Patescibacteria group bacterium]|jgi:hypothetical protein